MFTVEQSMKSDVVMPDFKSSYQKMEKIASNLSAELANFHVGRANTEMLVLFPYSCIEQLLYI